MRSAQMAPSFNMNCDFVVEIGIRDFTEILISHYLDVTLISN